MAVVIPLRITVANTIQYIKTQLVKKFKAKFPFMKKPIQGKMACG